MVVKIKARGRMFDESSSVRSKMQKTESVMTEVVATVISKFQNSINKRQEAPLCSGGIWDYNPENTVEVNKSFQKRTEFQPDWRTPRNETKLENPKVRDQNLLKDEPSFLDELFPDLGSYGQFTPSENVQPCSKSAVSNSNAFSYEILPSERKVPIASSDSSKLETSGMLLQRNAKGSFGTPPEHLSGSLHPQSFPGEVYTPSLPSVKPKDFNVGVDKHSNSEEKRYTRVRFSDPLEDFCDDLRPLYSLDYSPSLPSGNSKALNVGVGKHSNSEEKRFTRVRFSDPPEDFCDDLRPLYNLDYSPSLPSGNSKALNVGVEKHANSEGKRITRVLDPLTNVVALTKELPKEASMNLYSKPCSGFHPKTGINEPNAQNKTLHSPKSNVNQKTFEQWSNERLAMRSPPKDQQAKLDQIQPLCHKTQSTDHKRLSPPTNTISPSPLKSTVNKLQEVEADYFYGVRSEFDMDCYDKDEFLRGDAESEEMECSKENAQPVAEEGMEDLYSKELPVVAKRFCRVSEFIEKYAVAELKILLEQMEEHGTKRKSAATLMPRKAKLNSRRNLHNSKSGLHSCNQSRYSKASLETSDVMVSLQVTDDKGNMEEDLVVLGMEIFEIKEGFPWIFNVIPAVDVEDVTLPYSAHAMAIVLRCVLQTSYTLPSWDVAVEVYAIAKEYRVQKLVESCKIYFYHNPIATADVFRIAQLVMHFEVVEVFQDARTVQVLESPALKHLGAYKTKSCTISSFTHKEPSEFSVPLLYSKGDLGSIRKSDFRNELEIESACGVHAITGVQIKFQLDSIDRGKVLIFCEVVNGNGRVLDVEKESQLQTRIELKFKKEICLRPKESVTVIVLIDDIKSSWCHCLKDEKLELASKSGMLRVGFKSHNKTSERQSLFFIDKVFYTN